MPEITTNPASPDLSIVSGQCTDTPDGRHWCAAHDLLTGITSIKDGMAYVFLGLSRNPRNLWCGLTPEGARAIADQLVQFAAEAAAKNVNTASGQLAAALSKKGG